MESGFCSFWCAQGDGFWHWKEVIDWVNLAKSNRSEMKNNERSLGSDIE